MAATAALGMMSWIPACAVTPAPVDESVTVIESPLTKPGAVGAATEGATVDAKARTGRT